MKRTSRGSPKWDGEARKDFNKQRDPIALEQHISEMEAKSKDGVGGTEM